MPRRDPNAEPVVRLTNRGTIDGRYAGAKAETDTGDGKPLTTQQAEATLRNTKALAEKHEIETQQLQGKLIEVHTVIEEIAKCNTMVVQRLQSLPATVTPLLVRPKIKPHEIETILRTKIADILNELAYAKYAEQQA
jgi:phage terminase Nu1 subunit (DNA packaging protein)